MVILHVKDKNNWGPQGGSTFIIGTSGLVHRHAPRMDAELRLKWEPLSEEFSSESGAETASPAAAAQPSLEEVPVAELLLVVQLHDGVISHASARRLDKAGWRFQKES